MPLSFLVPSPRAVRAILASDSRLPPGVRRAISDKRWVDLLALLTCTSSGKRVLGTSYKVELSSAKGYLTSVLYLAPHTVTPGGTLCPNATDGCIKACLAEGTGRMSMSNSQAGRVRKTLLWRLFPLQFIHDMQRDINALIRKAARVGKVPAVRPNGTSDIRWEQFAGVLMDYFPTVEFYDYTKSPLKARKGLPTNYNLCFSVSERPDSMAEAARYLAAGHGAAMVVGGQTDTKADAKRRASNILAAGRFMGLTVSDGDAHDYRPADAGTLSVLYAKGNALRDRSGFVQRPAVAPPGSSPAMVAQRWNAVFPA